MSKKRQARDKAEVTTVEEEKNAGDISNNTSPAQTFDGYQCTGNVETDFPALCTLLDIKDFPLVRTFQPATSPSTSDTDGENSVNKNCQKNGAASWWKQRLQVELENEDPLSAKSITASGWKIDEQMVMVLQKIFPSLTNLHRVYFWQTGLTDQMVKSVLNTLLLCSNLRIVALEGNPLPEQSFHCLLSADSVLTHVSLRNNGIDDNGARLIGSALSTSKTSNRNLLSLSLAFNSIGDEGAAHIAKGLRFNRSLLFLSLAQNLIGDSGAAHLAEVLGDFALTHEEVVERRKQLLERRKSLPVRADSEHTPPDKPASVSSSSSVSFSKSEKKEPAKKKGAPKKEEKPVANKEKLKSGKKASEIKASQSKGRKMGDKNKQGASLEVLSTTSLTEHQVDTVKIEHPLLDQTPQHRQGQLFLPGNNMLASLDLAGNRITTKSLPSFLTSVEMQEEKGGLLRLCLQRNKFPTECESYVKLQELLAPRLEKELWKPDADKGNGTV
ncbi:leucine-rich repeat-containing protein 71-like [Cynoglossus semilaevis]|uniref:Leucine rich repeat containing 71 n=1 Tax=Cynoglossus semilaevis TaxID=244447 RepID=A0A3P8VCA5_CYNSE|nr:leucine-rich repeat-containing protein 71-like [Cynoglossus semilaevis]